MPIKFDLQVKNFGTWGKAVKGYLFLYCVQNSISFNSLIVSKISIRVSYHIRFHDRISFLLSESKCCHLGPS